ncbi:MAG: hypothetical protein ABSF79_07910 [Smithellaceae bacterium]|jgi:hypothetical protein
MKTVEPLRSQMTFRLLEPEATFPSATSRGLQEAFNLQRKPGAFCSGAKRLLLILILAVLMGCPVVSKNIVGLQDFKLDAQKIDGTWINDEGAILVKAIDPEKGIIKIVFLEDKEKVETLMLKIMKGNSWLYFNILPEKDSKDDYIWGRFQIKDNKLIFWHPSNEVFTKAIKERKIKGTIEKKKQENGKLSFDTSTVSLTDSAKNIINLVESSDKSFFLWDEPVVFIKLAK